MPPPPLTSGTIDPVTGEHLQKAAVDAPVKELQVDTPAEVTTQPAQTIEKEKKEQTADITNDVTNDAIRTVDVASLERANLQLESLVTTNNAVLENTEVLNQIPVNDRPVVLARSLNTVSDAVVEPAVTGDGTERRVEAATEVIPPRDAAPVEPPRSGMSNDALAAAAQTVAQSMRDKTTLDAVLRAIPPENREAFQQIYKQNTGNDLAGELRSHGHDSSVALLNPKEEARNAAWLGDRLKDLSSVPQGATAQRELLEHSIRTSLRTMTAEQREALSSELKTNTGKTLGETLDASALSPASKEIAKILTSIPAGADAATVGASLSRIAEIGTQTGGSQGLTILKEALGGNSPEAIAAREQFRANDGDQKMVKAFGGIFGGMTKDLRQAQDYATNGKLDTATFIEMQRSNWANSDAGVELAARMMTQDERQRFAAGERLAKDNLPGATPEEREARQYYDRVHSAFQNAASSVGMISRWGEGNRNKAVTAWEDIAKNGELTLIGRMARAGNDFFADSRGAILSAMRDNMTNKDFNLMQDPRYRDAVYSLVGGRDGAGKSVFSAEASVAVRAEIGKLFDRQNVEEARAANHSSLREASVDQRGRTEVIDRYNRPFASVVFDALRNGKASEYAALSPQEKARLDHHLRDGMVNRDMPANMRKEAQAMLAELKAGRDVTPTLARDLLNDALKQVPANKIIDRLIENQNNLPQSPAEKQALATATRNALAVVAGDRANEVFEKFAKPLLDGKGISAESLREANMSSRIFGPDRLNHENYYNQLKHLPQAERERLTSAADKANTDPDARRTLDEAFKGMSQAERDIAISVLRNPNQEYSLSDRIRTLGIGGDVNQQKLVSDFQALSRDAKMNLINQHADTYKSFLPNDLSRNASESVKREIEMSMPMNVGDLQRAMQDRIRETGTGLYGNVALTEISIAQTQDQIRSQLLDHLPPEQREQAQKEIDQRFQALVNAIRRNDDAQDQYAKDLADKIVTVATTVVGGPLISGGLKAANLAKLAVTAAGAVAARVGIEESVKGEGTLTASDYLAAGIFGAIDGATMGRFGAAKQAFGTAVEKAVGTRLGAEARDAIVSKFDTFIGEGGEQRLAAALKEHSVPDPDNVARQILGDVETAVKKTDDAVVDSTGAGRRPATETVDRVAARVDVPPAAVSDLPPEHFLREKLTQGVDNLRDQFGKNIDASGRNGFQRLEDIQRQMQGIRDLLKSGTEADLEQAMKSFSAFQESMGRRRPAFDAMKTNDQRRAAIENVVNRFDNVDALMNGGRLTDEGRLALQRGETLTPEHRVPLSTEEMRGIISKDVRPHVANSPADAKFADQFVVDAAALSKLQGIAAENSAAPSMASSIFNALSKPDLTEAQRIDELMKAVKGPNGTNFMESELPFFEKELARKGLPPEDARRLLDATRARMSELANVRAEIDVATSGVRVAHQFDAPPTRESVEQAIRNMQLPPGHTEQARENLIASAREFFGPDKINGQNTFQILEMDGKLMLSRMEPGKGTEGMKVFVQPLRADGTTFGLPGGQTSDMALHLTYRPVDGNPLTIVEIKQGTTTGANIDKATDKNFVFYQREARNPPHVNEAARDQYVREGNWQSEQQMVTFFQNLIRRAEAQRK